MYHEIQLIKNEMDLYNRKWNIIHPPLLHKHTGPHFERERQFIWFRNGIIYSINEFGLSHWSR